MLGTSVPEGYHSISVSLPEWDHVVGYEESQPNVVNAMTVGYPRFRFHNDVTILNYILRSLWYFASKTQQVDVSAKAVVIDVPNAVAVGDYIPLSAIEVACMVVPNKWTGMRLAKYLAEAPNSVYVYTIGSLQQAVVYFPATASAKAKSFWQHCGEVISSRLAVRILEYLQSDLLRGSVDFSWWTPPTVASELTSLTAYCGKVITLQTEALDVEAILCPVSVEDSTQSPSSHTNSAARAEIIARIGAIVEETPVFLSLTDTAEADRSVRDVASNIALTPSGMSAIYTALRLALLSHQQLTRSHADASATSTQPIVVVFGFPYLDTLKMMRRVELNPGGCEFLGMGDLADLARLEQLLKAGSSGDHGGASTNSVAAIFTEFPSNPLMKCPDLVRLTQLARQYNTLLVVDDTIANFANVDLLHKSDVQVDLLCSSLSKIFNGAGDAMAGSLVVNSLAPRATQLTQLLGELQARGDIAELFEEDAVVVDKNSREFLVRSQATNRNAFSLAQWLSQHPAVDRIYYPGLTNAGTGESADNDAALAVFGAVARTKEVTFAVGDSTEVHIPGRGCLLSLVLKSHLNTQAFYNALAVSKGPSLGTAFTLVCPYTLLAHYTELEWAARYGVHADLIRVSVGAEPYEEIRSKFEVAFAAAESSGK